VERAVIKALEWLKRNQDKPGGSWGKKFNANTSAMTGLALLTFLAHGETTTSEDYGETVEMGLRFLTDLQKENGSLIKGGRGYDHGIATYALAEAYALTQIPVLQEPLEKAVRVIIDGQQPEGGYNYNYSKGDRWDTSVVGWQVQALKAAYLAGLEVEGLAEALDRSVTFLKESAFTGSGFAYSGKPGNRGGGAKPSMTGVGVLCLKLLGEGESNEAQAGIQYPERLDGKWDHASLYTWYYATQAKFHQGGGVWKAWNKLFAPELVTAQEEDGHWEFAPNGHDHGKNQGPVYSTTLAALTLQVYYRFLPTFKQEAVEAKEPELAEELEDEVGVKINVI
jgi:hypothetical protein